MGWSAGPARAGGDLVSIIDPDHSVRLFAFDADRRLTSQASKRNFVSTYQYGCHGPNTRADRPDISFVLVAPSEVLGLIDAGAGQAHTERENVIWGLRRWLTSPNSRADDRISF